MKQVMNYNKDNGLLNMIRRTDPMINLGIGYNAYDKDIVADSLCHANRKGSMVPFVWKRENRKRKAIPGN